MERVGGKFCSCETWLTPEAGLRPLPPQTCRPEAIASTDTFPRTRCHVGLEDGLYVGVKQSHISVPPSPHIGPRSGDFTSPRLYFLLANQRNPPTQMADLGSNEMTANLVHYPVLGTRWVLMAFVRVHLHPGPWAWPSGGQCWLTQV